MISFQAPPSKAQGSCACAHQPNPAPPEQQRRGAPVVPAPLKNPSHHRDGFFCCRARKVWLAGRFTVVALLGRFGVAQVYCDHPHRSVEVVDAVPDSSACSDLVLPLLHVGAVYRPPAEPTPERVLTLAAVSRLPGYGLPCGPRVGRCRGAELRPSFGGVAGGVPEVPASRCWRRGDPLPAPSHGGA